MISFSVQLKSPNESGMTWRICTSEHNQLKGGLSVYCKCYREKIKIIHEEELNNEIKSKGD